MFKCICGNDCKNLKALNYHKNTKHKQCNDCYKWFISEDDLNIHSIECKEKIKLFNDKMNDLENDNMMQIMNKHLDEIDIPTLKLSYKLYVYSKVNNNPYFISSTMITKYLEYSYKKDTNNIIEDTIKYDIDYVNISNTLSLY